MNGNNKGWCGGCVRLQVNDVDVYLSRKRIKNIYLRINAEGQVTVSAPLKCALPVIQRFLLEKQDWIIRHRTRQLNQVQALPPKFQTGEPHVFLGTTYSLIIHEHSKQQAVKLDGNQLCCYLKTSAGFDEKRAILQQWYRAQMTALIPDLLKKWEMMIGVKVNQWGIRSMKTRWGSCNTIQKRIWLNLHLIHKPLGCLEYVLVHELVHLLEPSHNKRFYALMGQFMPDWKVYKALLKEGGTY